MSKRKHTIRKDRKFKGLKDRTKKFFLYPEIKIVYLFRKAQFYTKSKNLFMKCYWSLKWLRIRKKGYQISLDAKIGDGLYLLHDGIRIIVGRSVLGDNCTIGVNVIIGYGYNGKEYQAPKIGDRVYIGHNTSIVGGITIGNDVLVAPNSYVNKSVPDNSIVLGNNIIIPKENASENFLNIGA